MKKNVLVRLVFLLLFASALPGCIWVPERDGRRRDEYHERDRWDNHGEHHGDQHDDHRDDHGDHRY